MLFGILGCILCVVSFYIIKRSTNLNKILLSLTSVSSIQSAADNDENDDDDDIDIGDNKSGLSVSTPTSPSTNASKTDYESNAASIQSSYNMNCSQYISEPEFQSKPQNKQIINQNVSLKGGTTGCYLIRSADLRDQNAQNKFKKKYQDQNQKGMHVAHYFSLQIAAFFAGYTKTTLSFIKFKDKLKKLCNNEANFSLVPAKVNPSDHRRIDNELIKSFQNKIIEVNEQSN